MKTKEIVWIVVSILAAAGVFGVCFVLYENEALPFGLRITVAALALVNLVCTIWSMQDMVKQNKK